MYSIQAESKSIAAQLLHLKLVECEGLIKDRLSAFLYIGLPSLLLAWEEDDMDLPRVYATAILIRNIFGFQYCYSQLLAGSFVIEGNVQVTTFGNRHMACMVIKVIFPVFLKTKTHNSVQKINMVHDDKGLDSIKVDD